MMAPPPSDSELLKLVLEPLLEDFQYWFERSRQFLETHTVQFLGAEKQSTLLADLIAAQQEVSTTQTLFRAMDGQVGIDPATLAPWHRLLMECWGVSMRFRQEQSRQPEG
jgi:Protein of unknown function (DUF2605)